MHFEWGCHQVSGLGKEDEGGGMKPAQMQRGEMGMGSLGIATGGSGGSGQQPWQKGLVHVSFPIHPRREGGQTVPGGNTQPRERHRAGPHNPGCTKEESLFSKAKGAFA